MATAPAKPAPTAAAANIAMLAAAVESVRLIPVRQGQEPLAARRHQTMLANARQ